MRKKKKASTLTINEIVAYSIVGIGAVLMIFPFYFMFVFATHTDRAILSIPPPLLPGTAFFENVKTLMTRLPFFWHNMGWSAYIASLTTVLNLFFCTLAGFGFAMYDFRFKEKFFAMVMGTMLMPAFITMIPTVLVMSWLGWMNQPRALFIPAACGALGVFMMRQYISSAIPKELIDAARIDGCSELGIFFRIIVPLVTPALGTLALITFIASWNSFLGPLIVMNDMEKYTVPLALRAMQGTGQIPWGAVCAGSAIAVLPLLVIFAFASRRLIDGLTAGAVKS